MLSRLEAAKSLLADRRAAWEAYSGNNPDKFRAEIADAEAEVSRLTADCKQLGLIPLTDDEKLWAELDKAFPNAQSRQVVAYAGRHFRKKFSPVSTSLSGKTVKAWDQSWEELPADDPAVKELSKPAMTELEKQVASTLKRVWPFKRPVGGLAFDVREGPTSLSAVVKDVVIGFRKGLPEKRRGLEVHIKAPSEVLQALAKAQAGQVLSLGTSPAGRRLVIRHKGASFDGIHLCEE